MGIIKWNKPNSLASLPKDAMYYARHEDPSVNRGVSMKPSNLLPKDNTEAKQPLKMGSPRGVSPSFLEEAAAAEIAVATAAAKASAAVAEAQRLHSAVLMAQQHRKKVVEERSAAFDAAVALSALGVQLNEDEPITDRTPSPGLTASTQGSVGDWDSEEETNVSVPSSPASDRSNVTAASSPSRKRQLEVTPTSPVAKPSRPVVVATAVRPAAPTAVLPPPPPPLPSPPKPAVLPAWASQLTIPPGAFFVTSAGQWLLNGSLSQGGACEPPRAPAPPPPAPAPAPAPLHKATWNNKKPRRQVSWATPKQLVGR